MGIERLGLSPIKKIISKITGGKYSGLKSVVCKDKFPIGFSEKLTGDTFEKSIKYTQQEIKSAYNRYSKSSYINELLRNGETLTPENQKLVDCLNQAINTSEPIKGKFIRGISGTRNLKINDETIKEIIFNNKGFTSTAPIENGRFAETFALGKKSAMIEFDLRKPIKGYKASNYEVLFAPNTFNDKKFKITKIGEQKYKVTQKFVF